MRSGVTTDKYVTVHLSDKNDEVPKFKLDKFTGQVDEELDPSGSPPVANVEAVDNDKPRSAASQVRIEHE